jgi:hypothetical protein
MFLKCFQLESKLLRRMSTVKSLTQDAIRYKFSSLVKVKVIPQQAELAQGVPGRLRPGIFLTFGIKRMVGRQP